MEYKFGLIGYPIKYSLSPWIHGEFFQRTNLQGDYTLIEIPSDRPFTDEIKRLKEMNLHGFNVTAPYKEKIIPFLNEVDEQAEKIGAVNTVLCKNDKWIGFNTDGIGYVRALQTKFPQLKTQKSKNILLLGAGGAAKGIYFALLHNGYNNITIANRSIDKAKQLIAHEQSNVITLREAEENIVQYDIIIQTSSVGMKPNADQSIISVSKLKKDVIVSDIVYQPLMTNLLNQAASSGAAIHFGHTMLLYQAQYAFEIWTNKHPEMDGLDLALQKILEG